MNSIDKSELALATLCTFRLLARGVEILVLIRVDVLTVLHPFDLGLILIIRMLALLFIICYNLIRPFLIFLLIGMTRTTLDLLPGLI